MTGVWATPDPIGILGAVNFYTYVKNNPVKWVDPLGLELEEGDDGFNDQGWGGDSGIDAEENGFQGDLGDYGDSRDYDKDLPPCPPNLEQAKKNEVFMRYPNPDGENTFHCGYTGYVEKTKRR